MSYNSVSPSHATLADTIAAINILYDHTSTTELKQSANQWLTQLQCELISWTIADQLLSLPYQQSNESIAYFAATTLFNKLVHTYNQLSSVQHKIQLRDSLLNHLIRYNQHNHTSNIVLIRLALCMSTLIVYMLCDNTWNNALIDITTFLTQSTADPAQQYGNSILLLHIYTYIPEQTINERMLLNDNDRVILQHTLQEYLIHTLLNALTQYMQSAGNNMKLQRHVYNCFLSWIRDIELPTQSIDISTHICYTGAVQAIQHSDTEEVAADIISQVIRLTHVELTNDSQAIHTLLPTILQLLPLFNQAVIDDNVLLCKKLSQIYVDLAETYIDYITYMPLQANAANILEALLVCVQHSDKDVSSHTFNFWYLLTENIDRTEQSQNKQEKLSAFKPYYQRIVYGIMNVMTYPTDYIEWSDEQREDSKRYRYFAADTLLDCSTVIGAPECLHLIWTELQSQYTVYTSTPLEWHRLEACLYCIRCIARKVDNHENTVIPQLFDILPHISTNTHMRYTATLIVGRYADWINAHKQYLPQLLQFIIDGLNDNEIRSSASLALRHVCEGSAQYMARNYINQLYSIYEHSGILPLIEQKQIIEALCFVVVEFDRNQLQPAIQFMMQPYVTQLQQQVSNNAILTDERSVNALDLMGEVYHYLDCTTHTDDNTVADCIFESVRSMWPLLMNVLQQAITEDKRIEKLCRVIKYAIKGSKILYIALLQNTVETMITAYNNVPHSAFLYVLSIVVDMFGVTQQMQQTNLVVSIVEQSTRKTLNMLKSTEDYMQYADIVEDYYELLSRILTRTPDYLLKSPLLNDIVHNSMLGLYQQRRESYAALMTFYTTLFSQAVSKGRFQMYKQARMIPADTQQTLSSVLSTYGQVIVSGIIDGIAGAIPPGRVQYVIAPLFTLLDVDANASQHLLRVAMSKYGAANATVQQIVKAESQRVLRGILEDWVKLTRRAGGVNIDAFHR